MASDALTSAQRTPKASTPLTSPPPHRARKRLPDALESSVSVLSPYRPPPTALGGDVVDPPSEELEEEAEKTNRWAGFFFAGAIVIFLGLSCTIGYAAFKGKVITVFFLFSSMACIVGIIGIAGLILQQTTKIEPTIVPQTEKAAPVVLKEGYFPGINNQSNTCFINAPTQAIMNDSKYPEVFKVICLEAKKRHEIFKKFLELFPSQSLFAISIPKLFSRASAPPPLEVVQMRDVMIMLAMRASSLIYDRGQFIDRYPNIYRWIEVFSKITKYANFPPISDTDQKLREEFGLMVQDRKIVEFFYQERSRIANELLGFESYLFLLQAYKAAVDSKSPIVSFGRSYVVSSPIDNIRHLIQGAQEYSQEDPDEFLRCLFKYVQPEDYPDIFFPTYCECTWAECPAADQNPQELREQLEKHLNPRHERDTLTTMPPNKTIRETLSYSSILTINSFLREGVSGQTLIDETFYKKNTDTKKEATFYIDADGTVKKYYRVEERIVIPPDKMPQKLILLLGRYTWSASERKRVKVDCTVNMPETIKISGHQYRLNSIVVHTPIGKDSPLSAEKGHYFAVVKKGLKWLYANDSSVIDAGEMHVRDAMGKGSLYFYEKI